MYIYRATTFSQAIEMPRASLREALQQAGCGPALRRAGRFNQLAVLGARQCCATLALPDATDVIVTSHFGNMTDTATVLEELLVQHQLPMPFNFMNTQNNSACYYVASELGLRGSSMVCSHHEMALESALLLAMASQSGSSLVGLVDEWSIGAFEFPQDATMPMNMEGSCWFLLSQDQLDLVPLAEIHTLSLSLQWSETLDILHQAGCREDNLDWVVDAGATRKLIESGYTGVTESCRNMSALAHGEALVHWLNQGNVPWYCRIHTHPDGRVMLVLITKS